MEHPFVGLSEMMSGMTKGRKLDNIITHNGLGQLEDWIFWYQWLSAYAMFDVTCFTAFVEALDVISCILSIR